MLILNVIFEKKGSPRCINALVDWGLTQNLWTLT
jgi:hypothetical protein